jgi:ABC-three component (ABC-3C) system Middle Component 5
MLIYHPAYDLYHCTFRFLRLLEKLPKLPHEVDKLRILDFYLLFPSLLKRVSPLPRNALIFRRILKSFSDTYEEIADPHKLFSQLEPFQIASLRYLSSSDVLDAEHLSKGKVSRTARGLPTPLLDSINRANSEDAELLDFLIGPFFELDFYGSDGLKARTKLMEFRYDPE